LPPATDLADKLTREARGLELYVLRVEALARDRRVPKADAERAYAAGFILFYTSVERTLEQLFIGLLTAKLTVTQRGVKPVVAAPNAPTALRLVLGGRNYVDWLPFDRHTKRRAEALLLDGKPFNDLGKADRKFLARLSILRNALAHRSGHALKQFEREFILNTPLPGGLPPSQHKPVGYLRGQHAANQSRFAYQLAEAATIMRRLCT